MCFFEDARDARVLGILFYLIGYPVRKAICARQLCVKGECVNTMGQYNLHGQIGSIVLVAGILCRQEEKKKQCRIIIGQKSYD